MKKNETLEEAWCNRDEFAREHNYDLDAMVAVLQEMEKHPLNKVVDRCRKTSGKKTPGQSSKNLDAQAESLPHTRLS